MTVTQSLLVALFCITVVFAVLACLWGLLRLSSLAIAALSGGRRHPATPMEQTNAAISEPAGEAAYAGQLRLVNVEEPTAAMIMAIVSDTSGIPLSELNFRSIRLMEHPHSNDD